MDGPEASLPLAAAEHDLVPARHRRATPALARGTLRRSLLDGLGLRLDRGPGPRLRSRIRPGPLLVGLAAELDDVPLRPRGLPVLRCAGRRAGSRAVAGLDGDPVGVAG